MLAQLPGATSPVKVAIAGIGNCASSLVQAIVEAGASLDDPGRERDTPVTLPGVISATIGGLAVSDIRIVTAFDVQLEKVGVDVGKAIKTPPNCTTQYLEVGIVGVDVTPGFLADGVEGPIAELIATHPSCNDVSIDDITQQLTRSGAEVLVCCLPTGAREAVAGYAQASAAAGVAFVNATPEPVALDESLRDLFAAAHVPLLGDDLRSQLGSTALHAALLELCATRGAQIESTYQLNIGGNSDFLNLSDRTRSREKWRSKHRALEGSGGVSAAHIFAGPVAHVAHLRDRKVAHLNIKGRLLLGMEFAVDVRLDVEDSPNAAGVILDAVRVAATAARHGEGGLIQDVCPFLFKCSLDPVPESQAQDRYSRWIARHDKRTHDAP